MKNLMYVAVCILVLSLTACGSDDDGNGNCRTCSNGPVSIEVCDNGDGTFSIEGGAAQDIPDGSTFDEQFNAACAQIGAN
ncbi:hypothetical protein [Aquimarina algiphila]|uniref:hypothetical protein n=1 Tax=Aquimarina algiphila TaxID=2047982 RepID=UPI002490EAD4|nr:hypothetical protein [Aquimarina algiphila]